MITDTLRTSTRTAHDRLEARLGLPESLSDREQYRHLLERFYGLHRTMEPGLAHALRHQPDFRVRERVRLPLLELDLLVLGLTPELIESLPALPYPEYLTSEAYAIGGLYVLEGSTLGGQVLSAYFHRTLGVDTGSGGAFFAAYRENTARMWRSFKEAACGYTQRYPESEEAIVAGAELTFHMIEEWLCPVSQPRGNTPCPKA